MSVIKTSNPDFRLIPASGKKKYPCAIIFPKEFDTFLKNVFDVYPTNGSSCITNHLSQAHVNSC